MRSCTSAWQLVCDSYCVPDEAAHWHDEEDSQLWHKRTVFSTPAKRHAIKKHLLNAEDRSSRQP